MSREEPDPVPLGTLVRIVGEDFFASCAGQIGIVTSHAVSKMGDHYEVLVDGTIFRARSDEVVVVHAVGR